MASPRFTTRGVNIEGESRNMGYRMGKSCSRPHKSSPHLFSLQFLHDCNWVSGGRKGTSGYSVGTDCSWGNFPVEAQQTTTIQSGTKVINKPSRRIPSCCPMLLFIICLDFKFWIFSVSALYYFPQGSILPTFL